MNLFFNWLKTKTIKLLSYVQATKQVQRLLTILNKPTNTSEQNRMNLFLTLLQLCLKSKKTMKKRLKKTHKCIITFLKKTLKNYVIMKTNIKKIWLCAAICLCICSCGTTKVKVNRPYNGTYTTITVTTNNPISTSTDAKVENDMKMKGE